MLIVLSAARALTGRAHLPLLHPLLMLPEAPYRRFVSCLTGRSKCMLEGSATWWLVEPC